MKHFKIILTLFVLTLFTLTSCKDESVNNEGTTLESAAVKNALGALKTHFNADGSINRDNGENPTNNIIFDFCFDFVYPVTLSYNTGAEVTVQDLDGLVDILINMTDDLYINGIAFPFDVEVFNYDTDTFEIQTINNEDEFNILVESCSITDNGQQDDCNCTEDFDPVCIQVQDASGESFTIEFPNMCFAECEGFTQADVVVCDYGNNPSEGDYFGDCFELVYPFSIVLPNGSNLQVNNADEFETAVFSNYYFDFVYPFDILIEQNGQTVTLAINNADELNTVLMECLGMDPCNCTGEYNPVCVATPSGEILEYPNECVALCEGFSPNDFVDCEVSECAITNIEATVGNCIDNSTYTISLNFDIANASTDEFYVYFADGTVVGPLFTSNLPISLDVNSNVGMTDSLFVLMSNSNCSADVIWDNPDCGGTANDTCWSFVYPIEVNIAGTTISVNNDIEFDAVYNPATSTLVYPFDVTIGGAQQSVITPNDFYIIGEFNNRCQ